MTYVTEVLGKDEQGEIITKDVFRFKQTGVDDSGTVLGHYGPTGYVPVFHAQFKDSGIEMPMTVYQTEAMKKAGEMPKPQEIVSEFA